MNGRILKIWFLISTLASLINVSAVDAEEKFSPQQLEFFENRIRPLFVNHCQDCHGAEKSESDFRVDSRTAILEGGVSEEPAAISGNASASLLLEVVSHESDYNMPPTGKLSDQEISDLKQWVDQGLPWPEQETIDSPKTIQERIDSQREHHWALQPIVSPPVPTFADSENELMPIDAFLLEKLESRGLTFSPPATKQTLIRRATFDLTGLPPTFEEVQSFVNDADPDAYRKLIDQLLASPRYGQRWARHWLDVARYADTVGYAFSSKTRDYPFAYTYRDYVINAFNDDLPYDQFVRQQLAADQMTDDPHDRSLAALGFLTVGRQYIDRVDLVDDRIDVVTRGLMGLTVGCARCHDHKFDGVSTEDYYSLYGILNNCDVPNDLPLIGQPPASAAEFVAELKTLKAKVQEAEVEAKRSTRQHLFEHVDQYAAAVWLSESEDELRSSGVIKLSTEDYRGEIATRLGIYWRKQKTNPLVKKVLADLEKAESFEDRRAVAEQFAASLKKAADKYLKRADSNKPWEKLFPQDSDLHDSAALIFHKEAPPQWRFGLFRVLITRKDLIEIRKLKAVVTAHYATSPRGFDRAMVVQDRNKIQEPYVMVRGDVDRRGKTVPRRFPALLLRDSSNKYSNGAGRLELANDIVSPDNPLTPRVIVNRVWMHHFNKPLVGTPSDFGMQGDRPSHEELLNWLAADFIKSGWSLKKLHRKMMLSRAYQQSSLSRSDGRDQDVENRLLWRMNSRRIEIEALRDSILFAAGNLDESLSGRGVKQFEPPYDNRRTIYGVIDRQELAGELRVFDVASPDQSAAKRTRTHVPQQSLFLMNSQFVIQQADALAARAEASRKGGVSHARFVDRLFQLTLSRNPTRAERVAVFDYIKSADSNGRKRASHLMLMLNEFEMVD